MKQVRIIAAAVTAAMALTISVGGGSATASTIGFVADSYPVNLTGINDGLTTITIPKLGTLQSCKEGGDISGRMELPTTALDVEVTDSTCGSMPLKMNGCGYTLHTMPEGDQRLDIGGSKCTYITLSGIGNTIRIYPQSGLKKVSYGSTGSGSSAKVLVYAKLTGLKYTINGEGPYENGEYSATWEVGGKDNNKNPVGIHIEENRPVGLTLNNGEFELEEPGAILGEQNGVEFTLPGVGSGYCRIAQGQDIYPTDSLLLTSQSGCSFAGLSVTAKMNGCALLPHLTSSAAGNVQLFCPSGGGVEYVVSGVCSFTISPGVLGAATFSASGSGSTSVVTAKAEGSNVKYSGCFGAGTNGEFKWRMTLGGLLFNS